MAHRELAWLFHEPHTGLDDCLRVLQACFRKRMSVSQLDFLPKLVPQQQQNIDTSQKPEHDQDLDVLLGADDEQDVD